MKLKVCGMKYQDNIAEVAALKPDYMGFIFYDRSPRHFYDSIPKLTKNINKTGVFVNATLDDVIEKIQKYDLNIVQLHGEESPEFCDALKKRHYEDCQLECSREQNDEVISSNKSPLPKTRDRNDESIEVIKVFSINPDSYRDQFDFEVLKPYETVCDYYLFDTKGKDPGGNGYTFNWNVLKNYPSTKPYFLSGGIGLNEVENVLSFLRRQESRYCYAIDVNSGFEIEPGLKDVEQLRTFRKSLSYLRRQESN